LLEGEQNTPSDFGRVFDSLQARRKWLPKNQTEPITSENK
jgi:hypothetical protein